MKALFGPSLMSVHPLRQGTTASLGSNLDPSRHCIEPFVAIQNEKNSSWGNLYNSDKSNWSYYQDPFGN